MRRLFFTVEGGEQRGVERDQPDERQPPTLDSSGLVRGAGAARAGGRGKLTDCMMRLAVGLVHPVLWHELGWKNVFKMGLGQVTRIMLPLHPPPNW